MDINQALNGTHSAEGFLKIIGEPGGKGLHAEVKGLGGRRFSRQGYEGTVSISEIIAAASNVIRNFGATNAEKSLIEKQIKVLDQLGDKALAAKTGSSKFAHAFHKLFGGGSNPEVRNAVLERATLPFNTLATTLVVKFNLPSGDKIKLLFRDAVKDAQKEGLSSEREFIQKVKDKFTEVLETNKKSGLQLSDDQVGKAKIASSKAINQAMKNEAHKKHESQATDNDTPITPRSRKSRPKASPPVTRTHVPSHSQETDKNKAA